MPTNHSWKCFDIYSEMENFEQIWEKLTNTSYMSTKLTSSDLPAPPLLIYLVAPIDFAH